MVGRELDVARRARARVHAGRGARSSSTTSGSRATAATTRCAGSRSTSARGRDRGRRRRRGQRPARARRGGRRACGPPSSGEVRVAGKPLRGGDAREAIRAGVAHVPEDRLHTGVAPSLSIGSNTGAQVVPRPRRLGRAAAAPRRDPRPGGRADPRTTTSAAATRACRRGCSPAATCRRSCSAREFSGSPRVLVAASPTRGLDVSAIETVHTLPARRRRQRHGDPADQRGPRRDHGAGRPHRRHVRGPHRRRARRARRRPSRSSAC